MKNQTSIVKFEEFFASEYKDELFEVLENYPQTLSLNVDYNKLEMFDPDLADLLIDKPEEVIEAAQNAIKNIDPLIKGVNLLIKFLNVSNVFSFSELTSQQVGEFIVINECSICNIQSPTPKLDNAVFECRGCMRLHEVEQHVSGKIIEPTLCSECGGRSFRLLQEESDYIDTQIITVTDESTSRRLPVVLKGDVCSYDDYLMYEKLRITGVLKTFRDESNDNFGYYFEANNVVRLPDSLSNFSEIVEDTRNTPEYREWVNSILNRDKVCQCCGGEKHLEAHHVFGYKNNPDYRLNTENGIALCKWCHGKYHSYYGLANANPQSLIKFIRRFGKY